MAEKEVGGVAVGHIRMADGGIAFLCARRLSLVFALAAAIPPVGLDLAARRLDCEHYSDLRRLAYAHTWTPVGGSWLDRAVGVRIGSNDSGNHRAAPAYATRRAWMLNELSHMRSRKIMRSQPFERRIAGAGDVRFLHPEALARHLTPDVISILVGGAP